MCLREAWISFTGGIGMQGGCIATKKSDKTTASSARFQLRALHIRWQNSWVYPTVFKRLQ